MAVHDDRAACALLTPHLQKLIDLQLRQLGHPPRVNCRTFASHWDFPPSPVGHPGARIERLRVGGRTATVELSAPGGLETEATLRKEDGRWRVDNYQ